MNALEPSTSIDLQIVISLSDGTRQAVIVLAKKLINSIQLKQLESTSLKIIYNSD